MIDLLRVVKFSWSITNNGMKVWGLIDLFTFSFQDPLHKQLSRTISSLEADIELARDPTPLKYQMISLLLMHANSLEDRVRLDTESCYRLYGLYLTVAFLYDEISETEIVLKYLRLSRTNFYRFAQRVQQQEKDYSEIFLGELKTEERAFISLCRKFGFTGWRPKIEYYFYEGVKLVNVCGRMKPVAGKYFQTFNNWGPDEYDIRLAARMFENSRRYSLN